MFQKTETAYAYIMQLLLILSKDHRKICEEIEKSICQISICQKERTRMTLNCRIDEIIRDCSIVVIESSGEVCNRN
jgi:hypothetical protein